MSTAPPNLPPSGCPAFYPALLSYVREQVQNQIVDSVIFQSLLLCLVSGSKHLILRTSDDDIGHVLKLTSTILSGVFGYSTHKVRIRPSALSEIPETISPNPFLRSLFIHHHHSATTSEKTKRRKHKRSRSSNKELVARSSSWNDVDSHQRWQRLASEEVISSPFATFGRTASTGINFAATPTEDSATVTTTSSSSRFSTASTVKRAEYSGRPGVFHASTDPTPITTEFEMPKALVVSGLEHASVQSQRALINVLGQRRVVLHGDEEDGIWNLPDGFILVYVCNFNPRERPAIHKTLLDKFAMSATVTLNPTTRVSLKSPTVQTPLHSPQPLPASLPHLPLRPSSTTPSPNPPISAALLDSLKQRFKSTSVPPLLSLYASDLFTATRHDQRLDGTLLTSRCTQDALDMARAARVLGIDLTGAEFIRELVKLNETTPPVFLSQSDLSDEIEYAHAFEGMESVRMNLLPPSTESLTTTRVGSQVTPHKGRKDDGESSIVTQGIYEGIFEETLDVSQADIARVVPRVMSHRLCVRDRPNDAVLGSAIYGAVQRGQDTPTYQSTVKEVLVQILTMV